MWNNHEAGMYRCVCCGTELFRSDEKFESGTGWPSFTAPAAEENVATETDRSFFMDLHSRADVREGYDAHLGHVFRSVGAHGACAIASIRRICVSNLRCRRTHLRYHQAKEY